MTLRPVEQARALIAYLEDREPVTTEALAPVLRGGLSRRGHRAWWVADSARPAGAIVLERIATGVRCAHLVVDDPGPDAPTARAIGAFLQRSSANALWGTASAVDPVLPHLPRAVGRGSRQWLTGAALSPEFISDLTGELGVTLAPGFHLRRATLADLDDVLVLFSNYELYAGMRERRIKRWLRDRIVEDALFVAIEAETGRFAAGSAVYPRTARYSTLTSMAAPTEFRGRGLGAALVMWIGVVEAEQGRGAVGKRSAYNGMRQQFDPIDDTIEVHFASVPLAPRRRDRPVRKVLSVLSRVDGRRLTPPVPQRPRFAKTPDAPPPTANSG